MDGIDDFPRVSPEAARASDGPPGSVPLGAIAAEGVPSALARWIRTPCGRAKYLTLAARPGLAARLRLGWFVLIAALRDLGQPLPEGEQGGAGASESSG